jgi:hypothetical protein
MFNRGVRCRLNDQSLFLKGMLQISAETPVSSAKKCAMYRSMFELVEFNRLSIVKAENTYIVPFSLYKAQKHVLGDTNAVFSDDKVIEIQFRFMMNSTFKNRRELENKYFEIVSAGNQETENLFRELTLKMKKKMLSSRELELWKVGNSLTDSQWCDHLKKDVERIDAVLDPAIDTVLGLGVLGVLFTSFCAVVFSFPIYYDID